jgi:hypothetical protein
MAGNKNSGSWSKKPFRDALNMQIIAAGEDQKALRRIADALLSKAYDGDMQAIKEVADRLDGKVPQGVEGTEDGPAIKTISEVVHRIIRANAGN